MDEQEIADEIERHCEDCRWLKDGCCKKSEANGWPLNSDRYYENPNDWCKDYDDRNK